MCSVLAEMCHRISYALKCFQVYDKLGKLHLTSKCRRSCFMCLNFSNVIMFTKSATSQFCRYVSMIFFAMGWKFRGMCEVEG